MIDLHAHLLPGVDDGPSTWDEAIAMVRIAAAEGITAMVATSHMMFEGPYINTRERLLALVSQLQDRVLAAGIHMRIYPGAEVYMTPDLGERLARREVLTYCNAGRFMLVEMPTTEVPAYAPQVIDDLRLQGVTPIIAHPERNLDIVRKPSVAHMLVERGALLQVTASSLKAVHAIRVSVRYLFRHGLVHFVATDAHGAYARRPRLANYLSQMREWLDERTVQQLILHNPAAVLAGEPIESSSSAQRGPNAARTGWREVVRHFIARPAVRSYSEA